MFGFSWKKPSKAHDDTRLPVWSSGAATAAMWQDDMSLSSYGAQAERYTRSDLVYMCVNKLAEMTAMQQLNIFDGNGERDSLTGRLKDPISDHPFFELWKNPNPWDSNFEFMEATSISLDLSGNSFWHLDDGSQPVMRGDKQWIEGEGPPIALWMMRPDRVRILPSKEKYIEAYVYNAGGEKIYFEPSRVVHFKRYHPVKDYEGLSPLEPLSLASASDIEAQKTNFSLFRNAMRLSGIVESDRDHVDLEQMAMMEKYLKERYSGTSDKAHQVAFLWSQFKYRELGMSMRDAEFIEGTKMNRMRIFGVYGVHPGIVLSDDVNLANARMAEYVTKAFTLAPRLERIAGDITKVLHLWPELENSEARFVNVVPKDSETEANIADKKSLAVERLITSLGPSEGAMEAQRQGLLTDEVDINQLVGQPPPTDEALPFGVRSQNGHSRGVTTRFFRY